MFFLYFIAFYCYKSNRLQTNLIRWVVKTQSMTTSKWKLLSSFFGWVPEAFARMLAPDDRISFSTSDTMHTNSSTCCTVSSHQILFPHFSPAPILLATAVISKRRSLDFLIEATWEFQVPTRRDKKLIGCVTQCSVYSITKHIATTVVNGTIRHMIATFLHVIILPRRKTIKKPNITAIPAQDVNMPLIDGWLMFKTWISYYGHTFKRIKWMANIPDLTDVCYNWSLHKAYT